MYCEYCALCYEFGIDAFAYQEKLVPGGATNEHWDPYFHWIMNEQIPHFGDRSLYHGSKRHGSCWINNCEYCQLHGETGSAKQKRNNTKSHTRVSKVSSGKMPRFPFEACPRWSLKASRHVAILKRCRYCSVLNRLTEEQVGQDTHVACFTSAEEIHNHIFLRRLLFALSPLAQDWEAEPFPGDDLLWTSHVLVTEIDLTFPTHIRFAPDIELPNSVEKGHREQHRAPSPYPVSEPVRAPSPYPVMPSREPDTAKRRRAANAERSRRLFLTIPETRGSGEPPGPGGRGGRGRPSQHREGNITFVSPRYSSPSPPPCDGSGGGDPWGGGAPDRHLSSARAGRGQHDGSMHGCAHDDDFIGIDKNYPSPKAMSFGRESAPTSTITAAKTRAEAEPLGSEGCCTTTAAQQQKRRQKQQQQQYHWSASMAAWDEQDYDNSHGRGYDATTLKSEKPPPIATTDNAQKLQNQDQRSRKGSGESVASTDTFSSSGSSAGPQTPTSSAPDSSVPRARRLSWWQGFRIFVGVDKDPDICTFCGFYFPSCTCVYLDEETGQMIKANPIIE
jgi:hypothetical protein